ncbi:MAG: phosphatase PAP2 family protein [Candidatus Altiarchaeota archaeon]|nr:phosphatase PAP2 family protein [Candidatus Altiarchaeota archaeon]
MTLNTELFQIINGLAGSSALLDTVMIFLSEHMIWLTLGYIGIRYLSDKHGAIRTISSGLLAYFAAVILAQLIGLPRPFSLGLGTQLVEHAASFGLPSRHTSTLAGIAFQSFELKWKSWKILVIIAVLVGLARIYTGLHFPIDILAGLAVGWVISKLVSLVYKSEK